MYEHIIMHILHVYIVLKLYKNEKIIQLKIEMIVFEILFYIAI